MEKPVIVTADAAGNVVIQSANNPEWGHIRVEQTRIVIDENGFAKLKTLSALVHGKIEDLQQFGWQPNQELPGRIVVRESMEPFNKKDPSKDYKIAGDSGIVCTFDGEPIYRKNIYSPSSAAVDYTIAHNNTEEIREFYAEKKKSTAIEPNEEFEL